jgi:alpha-N-acetylglucosamine transferase
MLDDKDIEKLSEVFVTKEDIKELVAKKDFDDFKNESLSKLDKILEGIEPLKQEKVMKDLQDKNQKKVLEIHNNALKRGKILIEGEVAEIDTLRAF